MRSRHWVSWFKPPMYESPRFLSAGDAALVVEFGDSIDAETNRHVHLLANNLDALDMPGIIETVPTYRSLLVSFDPRLSSVQDIRELIEQAGARPGQAGSYVSRLVTVPTLYGGDYGPDIEFVAEGSGLSVEEVVAIHSGAEYLVYMMGFNPGFPYLGGLDPRLATPRLESPRVEIPAGSVGIAEAQTGVYPLASPGGWRLIGRTPLRLFDPNSVTPSVINAGDYVRFAPMGSEAEYRETQQQIDAEVYQVSTETRQ